MVVKKKSTVKRKTTKRRGAKGIFGATADEGYEEGDVVYGQDGRPMGKVINGSWQNYEFPDLRIEHPLYARKKKAKTVKSKSSTKKKTVRRK